MKFDQIFLKFGKLTSNYITKLSSYARQNYEIFENFGTLILSTFQIILLGIIMAFDRCYSRWQIRNTSYVPLTLEAAILDIVL